MFYKLKKTNEVLVLNQWISFCIFYAVIFFLFVVRVSFLMLMFSILIICIKHNYNAQYPHLLIAISCNKLVMNFLTEYAMANVAVKLIINGLFMGLHFSNTFVFYL